MNHNISPKYLTDKLPNPRMADLIDVWEYDMGDTWLHEIFVEKITSSAPPLKAGAVCLDGARACPPEDCGGIGGYEVFLNAINDPKHEDHEDMLEWIGGEFDPEAFDLVKTDKTLGRLKK